MIGKFLFGAVTGGFLVLAGMVLASALFPLQQVADGQSVTEPVVPEEPVVDVAAEAVAEPVEPVAEPAAETEATTEAVVPEATEAPADPATPEALAEETPQPQVTETVPAAADPAVETASETPVVAEVEAPVAPEAPATLEEPVADPAADPAATSADPAPAATTETPPAEPEAEATATEVASAPEPETATEAEPEAAAVATAEVTPEPAAEPEATEGTTETAAVEAPPETVADPTVEPVTESSTDPAAEPVTETTSEPVADPAATAEPAAEPATEPAVEPEATPEVAPNTPAEPEAMAEGEVAEGEDSTFAPSPGFASEGAIVDRDAEAAAEAEPEAETPLAEDAPPLARFAASFENPDAKPVLAIVLIDSGAADLDRAGLAALPFPVSFALDPMDPATPEHAAIYRAAGREVIMLATGIAQGATASDVEVAFQSMVQGLPEAVAVMDLAEPVFQNDRPLATLVVPVVGAEGRGVLTWEKGLNAADQVARREDIAAAVIFRDLATGGGDVGATKRTLDRAVFKAGQDGRVVVAGLVTPELVAGLLEWSVEGRAGSVALGPVTAVLQVD